MKITVLLENSKCREELTCEHGLSLHLQTLGKNILFDAGQTAAFAENAEKLEIDLKEVDLALLSHGHYDHGGGLATFLKRNDHAPVYLQEEAFAPCYDGKSEYIGLAPELMGNPRLIPVRGEMELGAHMRLLDGNDLEKTVPVDAAGLTRKREDAFLPDDFRHEQYLLLEENGKRICVSGCSHKGILNIVRWFKPDVLIGGFHFMKLDPAGDGRERLLAAAQTLLEGNTVYYTGHCTGDAQYDLLKQVMGDRLHRLSTGDVFEI